MRISHGTRFRKQTNTNGYGYATERMLTSLARLGYEVNPNDPTADVQFWFEQPQHWKWHPNQYKVGYLPWESTKLLKGWQDYMNVCDEIWTPSPLVAEWFKDDGVTPPVYVYGHGVDKIWTPVERKVEEKFRFLHVGFEAARKGGPETMRAFRAAFPNNTDVELVLKMNSEGWNIADLGRIKIVKDMLPIDDLVALYHSSHAFVYPSRGEGFGLNPLQAAATGMPVITLPDWAPYSRFLDNNLNLSGELRPTPWEEIHPGKMFRLKHDELVDRMRYVYENYDQCHSFALDQTEKIAVEYDWDLVTSEVFSDLEKRLKNL